MLKHDGGMLVGAERCEEIAVYMIENSGTVRSAAKVFGSSKSTVHKDVSSLLREINPSLYSEVKKLLDKNKSERHIRGGEATKQKYSMKKNKPGNNE